MIRIVSIVSIAFALAATSAASAQLADLSWNTIDCGGGQATGDSYALYSSIGQPDAGVLTGGGYTLVGGFLGVDASPIQTCPADVNANGTVDVDDMLAVINGWGKCAAFGEPCPGDITGDATIDVDDLLAVINGWGPCP